MKIIYPINTNAHFNFIKNTNIKFIGKYVIYLCSLKNFFSIKNQQKIYLGLKVSKKFGNAVKRNLFRRHIKAIITLQHHLYKKNTEQDINIVIIPRKAEQYTFNALKEELERAWNFINKKNHKQTIYKSINKLYNTNNN